MERLAQIFLSAVVMASLSASATGQENRREQSNGKVAVEASANEAASSVESTDCGSGDDSEHRQGRRKRNLFRWWREMAARSQENQPDWLSPLATTSGRLKDELRYDIWQQPNAGGASTWQLGGNKGLEFITSSRTQILLGIPTYTVQTSGQQPNGFGDLPLQLKFRIASSARNEKNYLLTFILAASVPTGAHRYGAGDAVLSPALAFGKGCGKFDVQSTVGVNLPGGSTAKLGRQVLINNAFQYRAGWKLWPEFEVNSMFFETGKNAGEKQVFLTPGIGFGRVRIGRTLRLSSAAGMQIAATHFHTYNHRLMLSERLSF
jgi:hypothetical protein